MFCHRSCLCATVSAGNCRQKPLCVKMVSVIETEFRIRTLQAPLSERRNKDRLGHIFCNLRLIIVPGGTYKGRGDMRCSLLTLPTCAMPRSLPVETGEPGGTPHPARLGWGGGRAAGCLAQRLRAACEAEAVLHAGSQEERTIPWVHVKLDAQVLVLWLGCGFMGPGAGSRSVSLAKH